MKRISLLAVLGLLWCVSAHAQTLAVTPVINPRVQYGTAAANYCYYTYSAGTTSPLATFTDYTGGVQNSDPVIMDANGSASIWLGPYSYKIVFYSNGTSLTQGTNCYGGTLQWTVDNVPGAGVGSGSVAFSSLTPASNSAAGTFAMSGNTLDLTAAAALKTPTSAGCVPTVSGSLCYDTTAHKFTFGSNGATVNFAVASVAACSAGQFVSTPATALAAASCSAPSLTGSTLTNVTINGSSTFTGAITSATMASATISSSTLSGSNTNSGTLSGGTYSSPALASPVINTGLSNSGTGFQHVRSGACAAGSPCTIGWNASFADTSYTVVCSVLFSPGSYYVGIGNKTTVGFDVNVVSGISGTSGLAAGEIDCIGVHD